MFCPSLRTLWDGQDSILFPGICPDLSLDLPFRAGSGHTPLLLSQVPWHPFSYALYSFGLSVPPFLSSPPWRRSGLCTFPAKRIVHPVPWFPLATAQFTEAENVNLQRAWVCDWSPLITLLLRQTIPGLASLMWCLHPAITLPFCFTHAPGLFQITPCFLNQFYEVNSLISESTDPNGGLPLAGGNKARNQITASKQHSGNLWPPHPWLQLYQWP